MGFKLDYLSGFLSHPIFLSQVALACGCVFMCCVPSLFCNLCMCMYIAHDCMLYFANIYIHV